MDLTTDELNHTYKERRELLKATILERGAVGRFDMRIWNKELQPGCGTVQCIGGVTLELAGEGQIKAADTFRGVTDKVARWLGINDHLAYRLCIPSCRVDWSAITPEMACRAIDFASEAAKSPTRSLGEAMTAWWEQALYDEYYAVKA